MTEPAARAERGDGTPPRTAPASPLPPTVGTRPWAIDAALYGASALFAAGTALVAAIPLQRAWGRTAVLVYGAATVAAAAVSLRHRPDPRERRPRALLAAAVFVLAAVVPLAAGAVRRAEGDPGDRVQSEVVVVEEAANALLDGRDPYVEEYRGPLSDRPLATQVHLPYLPFMLVFGLPRAVAGHVPWADARVWFSVVSLLLLVASLRRLAAPPDLGVRTLQVLLALPTGALLLATGGVDVPVVALLLAVTVLAHRGEATAAGVVGGLALATKQTSILVLPFVVLAMTDRHARRRTSATAGLVGLALIVPFALWDLGAFVEDTVLFPLGAGEGTSAARTPTIGSLLLGLFPSARDTVIVVLAAAVVAVVALLLFVGQPPSMSRACGRAAGAFLAAFALAPSARIGYLVYPANLVVWAVTYRVVEASALPEEPRLPP